MATLKKSILIEAPAEKIFTYLLDPNNLLEIWPSLMEVKDVQPLPNGGTKFRYVVKMGGLRLEGTSEDTEIIPNQRMVNKSTGGVDAWATFLFEPSQEGTRVTVEDEYKINVPLVGKLAEAVIVKMNEHEAETLLENLKTCMEG